MGVVMFYQLTRSTPAETLRALIKRALEQDWRVMVRGTDRSALEKLDTALWLEPEDSFLPHGLQGGPADAEQPVLIGPGVAANGAKVLALLDGAEASAQELTAMERVWVLFDGADDARLQAARLQWKAVTATGAVAQYWSEADGRWQKKAESAARS